VEWGGGGPVKKGIGNNSERGWRGNWKIAGALREEDPKKKGIYKKGKEVVRVLLIRPALGVTGEHGALSGRRERGTEEKTEKEKFKNASWGGGRSEKMFRGKGGPKGGGKKGRGRRGKSKNGALLRKEG